MPDSRLDSVDVDSLERFVPDAADAADETLRLHLERYAFAAKHVRGARVLDCACGVGYGTALMSGAQGAGAQFVGVDISPDAVSYARKRYGSPQVEFRQADGTTFSDPGLFDTAVSLETIEHVPDPKAFVANLVSLVKPDGRIIASVPFTPSVDGNPHHLHDFTVGSFGSLFTPYGFKRGEELYQVQPFKPVKTVIKREDPRSRDIRRNLPAYYLRHPGALVRRIYSTFRYGFTNRYVTTVWLRG